MALIYWNPSNSIKPLEKNFRAGRFSGVPGSFNMILEILGVSSGNSEVPAQKFRNPEYPNSE